MRHGGGEVGTVAVQLPDVPRVALGEYPTPLEYAVRLSRLLGGPDIYIKRDDTGALGLGGNKLRKLEYLLGDALAQRADAVITCGAGQSNHARLTAAAARKLGLQPYLVLRGTGTEEAQGNLLLDRLLGAEIVWTPDATPADLMEAARQLAISLRREGRRPYVIPYGGSGPLGVLAYVRAAYELAEQARARGLTFDAIITSSSSGATQAGLALGRWLTGMPGRVWGMSADLGQEVLTEQVAQLAAQATDLLGCGPLPHDEIVVFDRYVGEGYGQITDACREAILTLARTEGIFLDPVYTGKAMAGLMDLIDYGTLRPGQSVVFFHTGGVPALFANAAGVLGEAAAP